MGLVETIVNGVAGIITKIAKTITSPLQPVFDVIKTMTTKVPAPDAGTETDNVYVFGEITQEPWASIYSQHQKSITIGFLILAMGWIASQALATYNITSQKGAKQRTNGLIVGTIMLLICWYIAALFLNMTQAVTNEVILNSAFSPGTTGVGTMGPEGDTGSVGAALFLVVVQLAGAGIFLIGFLLHAIRIYGIYIIMAILPILVALYYSRMPYLDSLAVKGIKIGIKFALIGPAVALAYAVIGVVDLATILDLGKDIATLLKILTKVVPMIFAVLIPIAIIRTNLAIAGAYGAQGAIDSAKQTSAYQRTVGAAKSKAKTRTKEGVGKAAGAAATAGGAAKDQAKDAVTGSDQDTLVTGGQENPMEYEESISSGSQATDLMDETDADQQDIAQVADESGVALEPQFDGVEAEAGRDEIVTEAKEARQELEQGRLTTNSSNQDGDADFDGERTQIGGAEEPVFAARDTDAVGADAEDVDPETAQEMVDFLEGGSSYDQFTTTVSAGSGNSSSDGGSGGGSSDGGSSSGGSDGSGSGGSGGGSGGESNSSGGDHGNSSPSSIHTDRFAGGESLDNQDTSENDEEFLTTDIFGGVEESEDQDTAANDPDQLDVDPTDPDRTKEQMEGPDDSVKTGDEESKESESEESQ